MKRVFRHAVLANAGALLLRGVVLPPKRLRHFLSCRYHRM